MARGNQRDKAREKNLKEQAGKVSTHAEYVVSCRAVFHASRVPSQNFLIIQILT